MNPARRKVCVVVTARASYARIRAALMALDRHPDIDLQLVVAASALLSRYGNTLPAIEADGLQIAARVYMVVEGENPVTSAKSTGLGLSDLATVFDNIRPDLVVAIADRYETLATSIAASYMNLPLAHIQGGEVTGSIDEKVRHANTKLADLHLVSTRRARQFVIRMGEDPERVFLTGCPSIDLARQIQDDPRLEPDALARLGGVGTEVDLGQDYLVVLQHPVTTQYEQARAQITETLHAVSRLGRPTFWFWPNVDAGSDGTSNGIRRFRELAQPSNIRFIKHVDAATFLRLVNSSCGVVGNSSVAIRECSYLGVPAVNIGSRQQGRERGGNVIDVEHDRQEIAAAIDQQLAHGRYAQATLYGRGDAGERIAQHLATAPLSIQKQLTYATPEFLEPEPTGPAEASLGHRRVSCPSREFETCHKTAETLPLRR
jgi:UDP-hydrolysing UDP-N-acetyl-D-glucosamine 2-epimerase